MHNAVAELPGHALAFHVFNEDRDQASYVLAQQRLSGRSRVTGVDEHRHA